MPRMPHLTLFFFLLFFVHARMSPAAMADGGEGSMSFLMTPPVTSRPAVDRPTVDKGNGQYEETQYSDGKVGIVNTSLFVFHQGFLT